MSFIAPMLASPLSKGVDFENSQYIAEEKYDGIRLIAFVSDKYTKQDLFQEGYEVETYSRYGRVYPVPEHVSTALQALPPGVYDGELRVPGLRSYGVTELINGPKLLYTIFDILNFKRQDTMAEMFVVRRTILRRIFEHTFKVSKIPRGIELAPIDPVDTLDKAKLMCKRIWARDGEGVILKNVYSPYLSGKRPRNAFIKMKQQQQAEFTVIGFEAGKMGPFSKVLVRDAEGNCTTVKTLNTVERNLLEDAAGLDPHPMMGDKIIIEFQERTPDGNYRHPRWDRWADE